MNSARKHLLQLHRKGFIRSPWKNQKRALEIIEQQDAPRAATLPLLGTVVAGVPVEAEEVPDSIDVPESLLKRGEHFALRVTGDSMIDDGIYEGDVLVVQRSSTAEAGATVVAVVDGEATVKRFYPHGPQGPQGTTPNGDKVELRPANERYASIIADAESVELRGVVVGLMPNLCLIGLIRFVLIRHGRYADEHHGTPRALSRVEAAVAIA